MNKWIVFVTFIVMSFGFVSGCTQQQTPPIVTNTITIKNSAFIPSNITITAGQNVTWINEDSVPHQVKGENGLFLSDTFSNGQTFTYWFNTTGTYNYICNIHQFMKGTIIVK